MSGGGRLVVCATPIGNLGDISDRLRETLYEADVVYAEDTRRASTLLRHIGARAKLRSSFVGNEAKRVDQLLADLDEGYTVAIVTDAGMPGISDPGALAVRVARDAGHPVTVIPGPSAATSALAVSGFGGDRFSFEGFLPRRGKERRSRLAGIAVEDRPVVVFLSPHRLIEDLEAIAAATGDDRPVTVVRELSKMHEEIWHGTIGTAVREWSEREPRGEFTLVIGPAPQAKPSLDEAIRDARRLVDAGSSPSAAAREVAAATGLSRRPIYEALIGDQERS